MTQSPWRMTMVAKWVTPFFSKQTAKVFGRYRYLLRNTDAQNLRIVSIYTYIHVYVCIYFLVLYSTPVFQFVEKSTIFYFACRSLYSPYSDEYSGYSRSKEQQRSIETRWTFCNDIIRHVTPGTARVRRRTATKLPASIIHYANIPENNAGKQR